MARRTAEARSERDRRLREQATILIIGVTTAVAILRMLQGPFVPVLKLEAFGLADTAAYQAINFGVAGRSVSAGAGQAAADRAVWALLGIAGSLPCRGVARGGEPDAFVRRWRGAWTCVRRGLLRVAALAGWLSHRHRAAVPDRLSGARLSGLSDTDSAGGGIRWSREDNSGVVARYARPDGCWICSERTRVQTREWLLTAAVIVIPLIIAMAVTMWSLDQVRYRPKKRRPAPVAAREAGVPVDRRR